MKLSTSNFICIHLGFSFHIYIGRFSLWFDSDSSLDQSFARVHFIPLFLSLLNFQFLNNFLPVCNSLLTNLRPAPGPGPRSGSQHQRFLNFLTNIERVEKSGRSSQSPLKVQFPDRQLRTGLTGLTGPTPAQPRQRQALLQEPASHFLPGPPLGLLRTRRTRGTAGPGSCQESKQVISLVLLGEEPGPACGRPGLSSLARRGQLVRPPADWGEVRELEAETGRGQPGAQHQHQHPPGNNNVHRRGQRGGECGNER